MKKEFSDLYDDVKPSEVSSIASAIEPVNAGRLPEGVDITFSPILKWVPKTDTMPRWQAAIAQAKGSDETFAVSPRLLKAYVYLKGKLTKFDAGNCVTESVVDFIKKNTAVRVHFDDVTVDDYPSKTATLTKNLPHFRFAVVPPTAAEIRAAKAAEKAAGK